MKIYKVAFTWDPKANVWTATSNDIQGLVLESGSLDALMERVKIAAPELIALNGQDSQDASLSFLAERLERIPAYG